MYKCDVCADIGLDDCAHCPDGPCYGCENIDNCNGQCADIKEEA